MLVKALPKTFKHKIPTVGPSPTWTEAGALYSLDLDYIDIGTQSPNLVARLLIRIPIKAVPIDSKKNW